MLCFMTASDWFASVVETFGRGERDSLPSPVTLAGGLLEHVRIG